MQPTPAASREAELDTQRTLGAYTAGVLLPTMMLLTYRISHNQSHSLMQDLKDAALTEAGADGGAGGLDGLYDGADSFPDFFQGLGSTGTGVGADADTSENTAIAARSQGAERLEGGSSSLLESLSAFGSRDGAGGATETEREGRGDILASLALPPGGERQPQHPTPREKDGGGENDIGRMRLQGSSADVMAGGLGERSQDRSSLGADKSEWARMQKQFEDMNKSFLRE